LPPEDLEELGKKVTRLRVQASNRAGAIEWTGDAADIARQPDELSKHELEE